MIPRTENLIVSGAYADIFRPEDRMVAYRLFASDQHRTNVGQDLTRPKDDERWRKTFALECDAYNGAAQHPFLRTHHFDLGRAERALALYGL